ncbi:hypothetical protein DYH09_34535 [bacterium CPR1]|nr:hypothetical protein [bacterium CPR1]
MNVNPTKAHALEALAARRYELLCKGDHQGAAQVEADRILIEKAPGKDLYEIGKWGQDNHRRLNDSVLVNDYNDFTPPISPLGMTLGAAGAAGGFFGSLFLAQFLPGPMGLALVFGCTIGGGMVGMNVPRMANARCERARLTADAVARQFATAQTYAADPQPGACPTRLLMADFVRLGRDREQELLRQSNPLAAADMASMLEKLSSYRCETLEQSLDRLYQAARTDRADQRMLDLVRDSGEVFSLVHAMAEVSTLNSACQGGPSNLELKGESLRIGSVVLRRKKSLLTEN